METILIATDFSSAARNATRYGFELAKILHAKVILFTAYQIPVIYADGGYLITPEEQEKECFKRLFEEAALLDPNRTVALETLCERGPVNSSILSAVAQNNVSYVVLGMKDNGKEFRRYIGSTVTDLCRRATVPLIVVPADAVFVIPKSIALASDITDETDVHILEPLKRIATKFQSGIHIVRVITRSMDEVVERVTQSESLSWYLKGIQHSFEYIEADNVAKALNGFVGEQSVNMVAVIPHEHSFFERLYTRSVTKELVFRSHVPLLVLPSGNDAGLLNGDEETANSKDLYLIY